MTAVEYLVEQIRNNKFIAASEQIEVIYAAKQMEKQQLYNFYLQGGIDCVTQANRTVEDFYNDTFKSE